MNKAVPPEREGGDTVQHPLHTDQTLADAYETATAVSAVVLWGAKVKFVYEGEFWHQVDPGCVDRPGCEPNHEPERRQMWSAGWASPDGDKCRFFGRGETSGEALAYCEFMMFREYAPWFAKPK